jgi:hypothetical protein
MGGAQAAKVLAQIQEYPQKTRKRISEEEHNEFWIKSQRNIRNKPNQYAAARFGQMPSSILRYQKMDFYGN